MKARVVPLEEGTDPAFINKTNQLRALPLRLFPLFGPFLSLCVGFLVISIYTFRRFGVQSVVTTVKPRFVPCPEVPAGLDYGIDPPLNLMHSMSDQELFCRALFVSRVREYPFRRVPKIAFMFLTKGPLPLAPLWEKFFEGHGGLYSIYVHSLPAVVNKFSSSSVFYKRQIPSQTSEWGKMNMCDAERRLLANALLDVSNEWFILVSESCIPLYNFSFIHHYIKKSKHSFIGAFDDRGPLGRGRYSRNMAPVVNITQWRKGSQWFEIDRKLAAIIVEDTTYYPKFEEFCKPSCYVDEHYFPTMLSIQVPNLIANRSITWADWSRGGPHPATFGGANITDEFFDRVFEGQQCNYNNQPSTACFLFARKFAPSALEPLMNISSKVMGF